MRVPLIRLECGCNSYEWGKVGSSSPAAKFAAATNFEIDENKPYAELWMGTHPSLPSKELETQRSLLELLQENQALVSGDIARRYGQKLPFLFKVLSITKALSIQAHPNKKLAEQLHEKDPANYKDDNHKPEMTIALSHCDGLCGFRPLSEISHFLQTVRPLRDLVGEPAASAFVETVSGNEESTDPAQAGKNKRALQDAFTKLMQTATSSSETLKASAEALVEAAQNAPSEFAGGGGPSPTSGADLAKLILRLNDQFPSDVGLFVLFFCNYVQLEPGEAMFLRADDIHAYLSGDMVECMAESDNVVRAGFTPKFKDVETLTNMLTYSYAPIAEQKMDPKDYMFVRLDRTAYSAGSSCVLYDPPIEEFSVVKTEIKAKEGKASFEPIDGPSVVICTQGEGSISVGETTHDIKTGYVYFVGATASPVLRSTTDENFVTFKAFCELPQSNGDHGDTNGRL